MIGKSEYDRYINNSQHWQELRQLKFTEVGRACQNCNTTRGEMHVHHIRYRNYFDCTIADLAVFCENCHNLLHLALQHKGHHPSDHELDSSRALIEWVRKSGESKTIDKVISKKAHKQKAPGCRNMVKKAVNVYQGSGFSLKQGKILIEAIERWNAQLIRQNREK